MKREELTYDLPQELIAQKPSDARDESRLMVYHRSSDVVEHKKFKDLVEYLRPGDLLVFNDTKVIKCRLHVVKKSTGAKLELLLLKPISPTRWWTLVKPGKRIKGPTEFVGNVSGIIRRVEGGFQVEFSEPVTYEKLEEIGEVPLPPYVKNPNLPPERYQTVYARKYGAAAAPTAGLHFSEDLLNKLREKGVKTTFLTLHVSLGTFKPIDTENVEDFKLHSEEYHFPSEAAEAVKTTKKSGGRVVAVGTTSTRVLETVIRLAGGVENLREFSGETDLFIYPPFQFLLTDALITNFHLPRTSLLLLVSAFISTWEKTKELYELAVKLRYRFFSFGDAMLVL